VGSEFSIYVAKENLKFSAAHFIAYPGFREPLHGHNYQVGVRVEGALSPTGYVIDFGLVKRLAREIVERIDERTVIPARSECLRIERPGPDQVRVWYGEEEFVFPARDVVLLPLAHSSAEEFARFIWSEMVKALIDRNALGETATVEISVAEAPGQVAIYRCEARAGFAERKPG
jgi:dihydroneopterin triphosphate aldolase (PTPS-III) / 6-pyruvoyltetrahydropterin synthase